MYFQQFDQSFSFDNGVCSALEAAFNNVHAARRESAQRVMNQDKYAGRLLDFERILSDTQTRLQEVLNENAELKLKLMMERSDTEGPPSAAKLPAVTQSADSYRIGQQLELAQQQIEEKDVELDALRTVLDKNSNEKKFVDDAILTLNVDLENSMREVKILREQRDEAESKSKEALDRWVLDRDQFVASLREAHTNGASITLFTRYT